MNTDKIRPRWRAGKKSKWIEQAWFAPTAAYPDLTDLLVSAEDVRELQALYSGEFDERDKEALKHVHHEIVTGRREFLWAFKSLPDVVSLIRWRRSWWFQSFPHPETISEYALNALYRRVPFDAAVAVDWLVFHGEEMWWDARSDSYQAGSMVSEIGDRTPRRYWYAKFGFKEGLFLVAVDQDQRFYRANEPLIEQIWEKAKRQAGLHIHDYVSDYKLQQSVEPGARRLLLEALS